MNYIKTTPIRTFPVRLEHDLMNKLERFAKETHINKTTISRIAISKFLTELETTGIRNAMNEVCQ